MNDLASRLRAIVRRETASSGCVGAPDVESSPTSVRELTYVPDPDVSGFLLQDAARCLGGVNLDDGGACVMVDRRYPADKSHGRRRIEHCMPSDGAPIHLFDRRIAPTSDWRRRMIFFDTETTGLSGGAGTLAFLVGCGWFDDEGFTVRQFFLAGPSGERALLEALGAILADASLLVTFNGRSFDVPLMETRWAFHRSAAATDDVPHFDMLPPARRLWSRRDAGPDTEGCSLSSLERRVLDVHRVGDVPGFEMPARYFQFLRSGNAALIEGVLEHNRYDIVSLAAVMAHALWLVEEGPEACREPAEQAALGGIYERSGNVERAVQCYEMAIVRADAEVQRTALARLAVIFRREGRHDDAARSWQGILDLVPRGRRTLTPQEQRAVEALAVHHEHRARDLPSAHRYARALEAHATGRLKSETDRRLQRIERKLGGGEENGKNGRLAYDAEDLGHH
ncbi:MAG: ribonuclease H-like domain-containing protein [Vicinamibacterales bacterium]